MDFEQAREEFEKLAERYRGGQLNGEDFADAVDDLVVTDEEGREWKIGLQTGKWYRKEGGEWVEAQPPTVEEIQPDSREKETSRRVRNIVMVMFLLVLIAALCLGSLYISRGGALFSTDIFGQVDADSTMEENVQAGEATIIGGGAGDETSDQESDDPSSESGQDADDTPTPAATQPPPEPSSTPTVPPPPPESPPQVWRSLSDIRLNSTGALTGDWGSVEEKDWEYEFIVYQDREALLLQFDTPEALFYSGDETLVDMERSLTLALPDEDGRIYMLCRWQEENGYALSLTQAQWALLKVEDGEEDIVLGEGLQPEDFQDGGYDTFRLRCAGDRISVWRGQDLMMAVDDDDYDVGTTGLLFNATDGIGLAYIARDQLRAHAAGREVATLTDAVRLGLLEVTLNQAVTAYSPMTEADYFGQSLISLRVRLSNQEGDKAVLFTQQNFYLTNGDIRIYSLGFVPEVAEEADPLSLPLTLERGARAVGEVFFAGIEADDLEGWVLVVDLRYQALGEARFLID